MVTQKITERLLLLQVLAQLLKLLESVQRNLLKTKLLGPAELLLLQGKWKAEGYFVITG